VFDDAPSSDVDVTLSVTLELGMCSVRSRPRRRDQDVTHTRVKYHATRRGGCSLKVMPERQR